MIFSYRAKQDKRTEAAGVIEAIDLPAAIAHLKQSGLFPLEVVPVESGTKNLALVRQNRPLARLEQALWARTVGQGLAAGLSLTQALHLLAEQEQSRPVGVAARALEEKVTAGTSLADALEQLGRTFPVVAVSLVRAGEASGGLEEVLQAFALQVESESELIGKVRGALIYPLFVLTIGIGTVAVLLWFVVPKLAVLFEENGQTLPWSTRFMIYSGRGLVWALLVGVLAAGVGFWASRRGKIQIPLAQSLMQVLSRLPWFNRLITQAEIARMSASLGLLLGHGLPLPDALRLVAGTISRPQLKTQIQQSQRYVVEGMSLSASLRRVGVQEAFLLTMVAMGEAHGDLAKVFEQTGIRYREEVDRSVKILSTLIEPVMILLVGLVVGAIVFSMLLPIFQINFTVG